MHFLAKQLVSLGLTSFEAQVYVGLLQRELTTAGALAKYVKIKRSTVYTILDSLKSKGLVSVTNHEAVQYYRAESPDRIGDFLAQKKQEIEQQESKFGGIVTDLKKMHTKKMRPPQVTIFEGKKGVDALLMRSLDENPKEVLVIGQYVHAKDHIPHYTERRIKLGIPTKVIIPVSPFGKDQKRSDKKSFRTTHLIDKKYSFPASIHIYETSVALFTYYGNEPIGVYIENNDIAETMRMIFALIERK